MRACVPTYEVRVKIKSEKPVRWHSWKDGAEYRKLLKMLHIERRTPEQAKKKAQKYGQVIRCRKLSAAEVIEREAIRIDKLPIDNAKYMNPNPYPNAVAMDEMIWKKRQVRRNNMLKRKE